jgi:DNA-binding CsgD family transcriptional regulator
MAELRGADAARLLEFVADAHAVEDPEPFTTDLLDRLAAVTESDFATYLEWGANRRIVAYVPCSYEARFTADSCGDWSVADEVTRRCERDIVAWSDLLDRPSRARFDSAPWAEFYGLVDCLTVRMRPAVLALARHERDFTTRDRRNANALRPHAAALVRHARGRHCLAALQAAVDSADGRDARGFVIVASGDTIEYASAPAQRLLATWFGNGLGGKLPARVGDWLASPARDRPLRVEGDGTRLVVEAPTRFGLILAEESVRPALTAREIDVLGGLAAGQSTAEIARELHVTPATVSKHLEHVYRKLGVASRTAALAAIGARVDVLR